MSTVLHRISNTKEYVSLLTLEPFSGVCLDPEAPNRVIFLIKNLGRLWLAYTELQGDLYMLQLISSKDVGLLWYHQMLERIMGNYQLKLPYILCFSFLSNRLCIHGLQVHMSSGVHLDPRKRVTSVILKTVLGLIGLYIPGVGYYHRSITHFGVIEAFWCIARLYLYIDIQGHVSVLGWIWGLKWQDTVTYPSWPLYSRAVIYIGNLFYVKLYICFNLISHDRGL